MTDRIHSITLVLERDMRVDDAEDLLRITRLLKGVLDAVPNVADVDSQMSETRARHELGRKVIDVIYPPRKPVDG